jgi:hypothetical protein
MSAAEHEAAHVTACLLLGLRFMAAEIHEDGTGDTYHVPCRDKRKETVALLAGHMQDRTPGWPPSGPPFTPTTGDGHDLINMWRQHGITGPVYLEVVREARELLDSDAYKRLHPVIAAHLEEHGRIDNTVTDHLIEEVQ